MKMKPWPVCPECGTKRMAECRFCKTLGDHFPLADLKYVIPQEEIFQREVENGELRESSENWDGTVVKSFLGTSLGVPYGESVKLQTEAVAARTECNAGECRNKENFSGDIKADVPTNQNTEKSENDNTWEGGKSSSETEPEECCGEEEHSTKECTCHHGSQSDGESERQEKSCGSMHTSLKLVDPLDEMPKYISDDQEMYPLMVMCPECSELIYPRFLKKCHDCGHVFEDGILRVLENEEVSDVHTSRVLITIIGTVIVLGFLGFLMFIR
ncbi:MAG: hypothetical protein Q4C96_07860 [Planctomycetia bacterium]|nr:hypothetical protein [Planctomycetia bacterium]